MSPLPALLVTCDDDLLGDVLRLAAAAGAPIDVAHDPDTALRAWGAAPVVLVGADEAARIGVRRPPRRDSVHVVGLGPLADGVFRQALAIGARDVVELPAADGWLVELLADAADGAGTLTAPMIGVVAGSGGAGASVFASALALVAAGSRPSVLVDLDPWGPGLDRLLGVEEAPGARWDALADGSGRLGSRSLRASLPGRDGVAVLAWGPPLEDHRSSLSSLSSDVVVEVLSAAQRSSELVVVDLPRSLDGVAAEVTARCDTLLVVCEATLTSVLSGQKVTARVRSLQSDVGLVVRGEGSSVPPSRVADALALPLLADYPSRRKVTEQVELGLGPVHSSRSPLARAAADVLQWPPVFGTDRR